MFRLKHVAVLIESSREFGRGLIGGISAFAATREHWQLHFQELSISGRFTGLLRRRKYDGILARVTHRGMAGFLATSGIPGVDLLGEFHDGSIPRVVTDDSAIGVLAVDFFISCGFRNLAFCGYHGVHYSDLRESSFLSAGASAGIVPVAYQGTGHGSNIARRESWHRNRHSSIAAWLHSLVKPAAVFCANDVRALEISAVCREEGISVPSQVAILGVDDDRLICNMSRPPLSSVKPDTFRQGYTAAALLDRMLAGESACSPVIRHAPETVVERASTDHVVTFLPHVAAAFRYLRGQLSKPIGAEDAARHAGVSRSVLDRDFKQELGRTISEELRRIRLQRIRQLLAHTDDSLGVIARKTGFPGKTALSNFFRSRTGISPGVFRNARETE